VGECVFWNRNWIKAHAPVLVLKEGADHARPLLSGLELIQWAQYTPAAFKRIPVPYNIFAIKPYTPFIRTSTIGKRCGCLARNTIQPR
jgi:hypothetical protein